MTLPGSLPADLTRARAAWDLGIASFRIPPARAMGVRVGLERRYRERHRAYHTLAHVAALTSLAGTHADLLTEPPVVTLAIWYHDAVYRPRRSDNEAASAALAQFELGSIGVPKGTVAIVGRLIAATADHVVPAGLADAPPFLDFDLAILASDPATYAAYARAIRREYRWVPAPVYRARRRAVLEALARRPRIYGTERLREQFEERARANLAAELAG